MKTYTLEHQGKVYAEMTVAELGAKGVPEAVIGSALKQTAIDTIADFAESCRAKLASQSAGKLAEYRIKEEIGRDQANGSAAELALLTREAEARGMDLDGLIALIQARAAAYRETALLVGVIEAEALGAVGVIADDDPNIEQTIQTVLGAAKAQADTAFVEAMTLINGGS
jgi:hypothetical protein